MGTLSGMNGSELCNARKWDGAYLTGAVVVRLTAARQLTTIGQSNAMRRRALRDGYFRLINEVINSK